MAKKIKIPEAPMTQAFGYEVYIASGGPGIPDSTFSVDVELTPQAFGPCLDEDTLEFIEYFRAEMQLFLQGFFGDVGPTQVYTEAEVEEERLRERIAELELEIQAAQNAKTELASLKRKLAKSKKV